MDFTEATDRLTDCPTHRDVAEALGMASVQSVRQARLDPSAPNYRSPPEGWETGVARLLRLRIQQLEELAEELEMQVANSIVKKRPSGAPPPPPALVSDLDEAIRILRNTEPTKDNLSEFQRAIEALDRLLRGVRNFDRNAFPAGFSNRVLEARWELNAGGVAGAQRMLERLRKDWDQYWA